MKASRSPLFLAVSLAVLGAAAPAHAYLDPGTGSMMLQVLLGGIVGALAIVRLYWYRIKDYLSPREATGESAESESKSDQ